MRAGGFQDYRTSDLATDKAAKSEGKGSLVSESAPPLLKSGATDVAVDQKLRIDDGKQCHQMGLDSISSSSHCVGTASRDPTCPFCGLPRPLGGQSS